MTTRTLLLVKPSCGTVADWQTVDRDMRGVRHACGAEPEEATEQLIERLNVVATRREGGRQTAAN